MNIFLTGGTGFIGSHFINEALKSDITIYALRRQNSSPRVNLNKAPLWLTKEMNEVDINDLKNIDVLVHLAAHSANVPYDILTNCIQKNVIEPLALFEKAVAAGVRKFIVAGSCFEYGRSGERYEFIPVDAPLEPTQTYPASKALSSIAFQQFAIQNNIKLSYQRIFQVYGEGELESRLWPALRLAAQSGLDFQMTKGEQVRDFIEVSQVAKKLVEACTLDNLNEGKPLVVNLGSGKPQTILEFSQYWWSFWNAKGTLAVGSLPYRDGEVMRFVPKI